MSPVSGRPEAAAAIWSTLETTAVSPARLRKSGLIRGVIGMLISGVFFALGATHLPWVILAISALIALLALIAPVRIYRHLDRLADRFGHWVGLVLAWLLLTPVFYLFFMPFRLLFRTQTRDTLCRTLDPEATTYWTDVNEGDTVLKSLEKPY